jgi:hypothetical protein
MSSRLSHLFMLTSEVTHRRLLDEGMSAFSSPARSGAAEVPRSLD